MSTFGTVVREYVSTQRSSQHTRRFGLHVQHTTRRRIVSATIPTHYTSSYRVLKDGAPEHGQMTRRHVRIHVQHNKTQYNTIQLNTTQYKTTRTSGLQNMAALKAK